MTLGQRIQQLRKEHGLSQEALGEALGVSRQAISKWESDITIPEIDNLIAMSRLFHTPVGVLLGVEEEDPGSPAAEELTDRELEAIEAIVGRYLEQMQQQKPRRKIWPLVVGCVAVLFLVVWMKGQLENLNGRMSSLQNNVNNISSSVRGEINSMTNQIQSILEAEASLLDDFSYQVTAVDLAAGTLTLDVSVTPKAYTEGMELLFLAEPMGQEPIDAAGALSAGHTFRVAGWTLPLNDEIKLSVSFGIDGSWQTQTLETLRGWGDGLLIGVEMSRSKSWMLDSDGELCWTTQGSVNGLLYLANNAAKLSGVSVPSAQLQVRKNGAVVHTFPLQLIDKGSEFYFDSVDFNTKTPVVVGDVLEFGVFFQDSFGQETFYASESVEIAVDERGNLDPIFTAPADPAYG